MIGEAPRRHRIGRDAPVGELLGGAAGGLLCGAALLPWNLYFGLGVPHSDPRLFGVLGLATLLALGSLVTGSARLRLALAGPYLLLVAGFVVFDAIQTIRSGGTARPPGGVGPGAWLGVAGALLAARPDFTARWARALGYASVIAAGASVLFNLYWRIRYALPDTGGLGRPHVAIMATAVVYGAVAWAAIAVAARWIGPGDKPSQLATMALGGSTLIAGVLVWLLPIGRTLDGFHGIAQNTSTAGVGFEGYLVWAAAAALCAGQALGTAPVGHPIRLAAARKSLQLIVVWCVGSALMRITDLIVAVSLDLPRSPYHSAAMAAFDAVTAVLAFWLRINLANRAVPAAVIWSTGAILVGFSIARIVVGTGLAPQLPAAQRAAAAANPVYGNGLAQQITSTFDLVLCGLAFYALVVTILASRSARPDATPAPPPAPRIFRPEAPTQKLPAGGPRIFRGEAQGSSNGS